MFFKENIIVVIFLFITGNGINFTNFWKIFNQYGLAILVALAGFIVWRIRTARRRAINKKYNPDDTRTITK